MRGVLNPCGECVAKASLNFGRVSRVVDPKRGDLPMVRVKLW